MKKKISIICFILLIVVCLTGCKHDKEETKKHYDNEVDTLTMSSQEVDGVFNPFFSTTAADGNVVGFTQIGMLGNDKDGGYTYGDDEAVVVKDLGIITTGTQGVDQTTTYYFVLKKNVQFSNGSRLSIKDVLFNLYVYLDPVYTGSSTIYSTDIVGLKEYQTQQEDDEAQKRFKDQFDIEANQRINNILAAADDIFDLHKESLDLAQFKNYLAEYDTDGQMAKDLDEGLKLFNEELERDYKNSVDTASSIKFIDKYGNESAQKLVTDVQAFLYNENYITYNKEENKLETSLASSVDDLKNWTQQQAIQAIVNDKVPKDIAEILTYWQTASDLRESLSNAAFEKYNQEHKNDVKFPNISGITFANRTESVTFKNEKNETVTCPAVQYDENGNITNDTYEVLKIVINDVDPKAIWNFAFTVAPMYYYSSQELIDKFDFVSNFGVERGSQTFMNTVVKDPSKIGLPVGAGPYQAASDFYSHNLIRFERNPYYVGGAPLIKKINLQVCPESRMTDSLYSHDLDYVEPNAKTETVNQLKSKAKEGFGSRNVKTAGYGYIGVNASKVPTLEVRQIIMHCIDTQQVVDYYGSSAIAIHRSMSYTSWAYPKGCTPYYPYLYGAIPAGYDTMTDDKINPAYQAFALSKNKANDGTAKFTEEEVQEFIKQQVETVAGYRKNGNGVYQNGTNILKYTFTIAGDDADHPAWNALYKASEILNENGFLINVTTDKQALSKLTTGDLTVWAAAWGGTIDPDMYQVYHMDSNATSVNNWGYKDIKNNIGNRYDRELRLLEELSDRIDAGRQVTNQSDRALIYSQALDIVMKMAIELPTYQRDDLFAYDANKIDESTLTPESECSSYKGLLSDLHKVSLRIS